MITEADMAYRVGACCARGKRCDLFVQQKYQHTRASLARCAGGGPRASSTARTDRCPLVAQNAVL